MKQFIVLTLSVFLLSGCGALPGGGRMYSDYHNAQTYAEIGATRMKVRGDFGKPDEKLVNGIIETWVYTNRQKGSTFKFQFNPQGMLISTEIIEMEE